jgi:PKD repeat protein
MKTLLQSKLILLLAVVTLSAAIKAQCSANFIYTNNGGGNITFTSTSVGTTSNTYYYWSFGDNTNFGVLNNIFATHQYSANATYSVTLSIVDSLGGCFSSTTQIVTVNNAPCLGNAGFSWNQFGNGTIYFTNTSNVPNGSAASWAFGDGGASNQYNPVHTYTLSGSYNVTLTVITPSGSCTYTTAQTISVTAWTCSLNASFTFTNGPNGLVNFSSTSTGTTMNTSYLWYFGDGNYASGPNVSHTYTNNGVYSAILMLQDSLPNYCSDSMAQTITVSNYTTCNASVSFAMMKDTTQIPAIVWDAFPNYPGNIVAATWFWGDGSSTNALYPSHTYSAAGFYNICVSITVSCGGTASVCTNYNIYKMANAEQNAMAVVNVKSAPTGIKKHVAEIPEMKLFPNPNNGEFEISVANIATVAEIIIYDVIGKAVYRDIAHATNYTISKKINAGELNNGTYFVQIKSESGVAYSKIIISR